MNAAYVIEGTVVRGDTTIMFLLPADFTQCLITSHEHVV